MIAGNVTDPGDLEVTCSILLVEDNKINQKVVVLMLARFGLKPAVADSGQQALELVRQKPFDLILMDLHMPGMDGIETTRLIRKELGEACPPIVALTADALSATDADAHQRGLDGYLMKPINTDTLRTCINEHTPFRV